MSKYRTKQIADLAQVFAALSNANRLQLLLRLIDSCAPGVSCGTDAELHACVGELSRGMGLAASTVSHHVKELKQAGLIRVQRNGQKTECSVDPKSIERLTEFFEGMTTNGRVRATEKN
jgi:ArsR family transcriptional regulator